MGYLVCDECGGYYELQNGESVDDFDKCQCGGSLILKDKIEEEPSFICPHCFEKFSSGIFCAKCGGDLIPIKNLQTAYSIEKKYRKEHKSQIRTKNPKLNNQSYQRIPYEERKNPRRDIEMDYNNEKIEKPPFLKRIHLMGVIVGGVAGIISTILIILINEILTRSIIHQNYGSSYVSADFIFTILSIGLIMLVMGAILLATSGALAAYIARSTDYSDGILNAFFASLIYLLIFGIFFSIMTGSIMSFGVVIIVSYIPITVFVIGGVIGTYIRKKRVLV